VLFWYLKSVETFGKWMKVSTLQAASAIDRNVRKRSRYCHVGLRAIAIALSFCRKLTCDADLCETLGRAVPGMSDLGRSGRRMDLKQPPPHLPLCKPEMLLLPEFTGRETREKEQLDTGECEE